MKISAQVVLINPEGLILGVSRKDNHNDFGLPGGKFEESDGAPQITAYRETLEETGLKISNLRLVFAIHKDGYMGYTYLADYEGEINHHEPHVVKWLPMERIVKGSFGKYNKLVSESLTSMGIPYQYDTPLGDLKEKIKEVIESEGYSYIKSYKEHGIFGVSKLVVRFGDSDGEFDEDLGRAGDRIQKKFEILGEEYGIDIEFPHDYFSK